MIFSEIFEDFTNLKLRWKILSVIGIISSVIVIILVVILILLFKTDLLQVDELDSSGIDLKKYDEFFETTTGKSNDFPVVVSKNSEVLDLGVVVNMDLLKIKVHQVLEEDS